MRRAIERLSAEGEEVVVGPGALHHAPLNLPLQERRRIWERALRAFSEGSGS